MPNSRLAPASCGFDLVHIDLKAGMSGPELTQKISQILPQAVDRMTPGGTIPNA
jgi:uncharacterized protein YidB (DUF937 family)